MLSRNYVHQSFNRDPSNLAAVSRKPNGKKLYHRHLQNLASVLYPSSHTETFVETVERKRFGRFVNSVAKSYVELVPVVPIQTYVTLAAEDWDSGSYQVPVCGSFAKPEKRSQSKVIAMYSDL